MGIVPDRWAEYQRIGTQIHGTRFIAFKVPLKESINKSANVSENNQLHPKLLMSLIPKLGMVIDLTFTSKYYSPEEFIKTGVEHKKIYVEGHHVPKQHCFVEFRDTVDDFLTRNADNDKLIGVHCTHGLNRTGFLVCRYMIEVLKIPPLEAIAAFEVARGHKMERENYTSELKKIGTINLPSLAVDTETDKGTQTQPGFFISEKALPKKSRFNQPHINPNGADQPTQQVALVGCVNIQRTNLIPDGRGGYFVHIEKKDIQNVRNGFVREEPNWNHRNAPIQQPPNPRYRGPTRPMIDHRRDFQYRAPHPSHLPHSGQPSLASMEQGANGFAENMLRLEHNNRNKRRNDFPHQHSEHSRRRF